MAMLRKTLVAAVACGSIAFAASAFAQAGGAAGGGAAGAGAGGTTGASIGSAGTGTAGSTGLGGTGATGTTMGTPGTINGGINSTLSRPSGTMNTNNSLALNSNSLGTNSSASTNNTLGSTAGGGTALGGNGVGSTANSLSGNQTAQNNPRVNAGPGVTNNLGTTGPAGSTSVSSALATTPGAGIAPNGAPSLTTAGGSTNVLGGNGVEQRRRLARATISRTRVAQEHVTHAVHHRVVANPENRHITRIRHAANIPGRTYAAGFGAGSMAAFAGLHLGNTATPVRGLSARAMARLNRREDAITAELNRAELNHVIAMERSVTTAG